MDLDNIRDKNKGSEIRIIRSKNPDLQPLNMTSGKLITVLF